MYLAMPAPDPRHHLPLEKGLEWDWSMFMEKEKAIYRWWMGIPGEGSLWIFYGTEFNFFWYRQQRISRHRKCPSLVNYFIIALCPFSEHLSAERPKCSPTKRHGFVVKDLQWTSRFHRTRCLHFNISAEYSAVLTSSRRLVSLAIQIRL